jgi:hypothetical protein
MTHPSLCASSHKSWGPVERQRQFHSRNVIETMCVSIVRKHLVGWRDIKRVTIRRVHPQGTGPNWEVERFEPALPATTEEAARRLIKGLQDQVALGAAS